MSAKTKDNKKNSNVININTFKKKNNKVISTIAAIIAVNVVHDENMSPEEYLIDNIELNENIELVAFEDALEDLVENSQIDSSKNTKNFVNDA